MSVYLFDVTATEVNERHLGYSNVVDDTRMAYAIEYAAGMLNEILIAHGITPSAITDSEQTGVDYANARRVIMLGSAAWYLRNDTGAFGEGNVAQMATEFAGELRKYYDNPQLLQSYNSLSSTQNTIRSTAQVNPWVQQSNSARARMVNQGVPGRRRM
jgi:hypothetical protein